MTKPEDCKEGLSKLKYRLICRQDPSIPFFSTDWWLDSVCQDGYWDAVILENRVGPIAALPYFIRKGRLFSVLEMPPLTQNFKIWLKYPENIKEQRVPDYQVMVVRELIKMLPKTCLVSFNVHYAFKNLIPFYWNGYQELAKYTYVIDDLSDLEKVFERFDRNIRNRVRKAEKIVRTIFSEDIDEFYRMNKKTFERQNISTPYSLELLRKHDFALRSHGARKIFFAVDDQGRIHSALYLIWDNNSSYAHMVGEDPELRSSGAGVKLFWDAIQFTANELKLNTFDFEGSMIESIERMRRYLGGKQMKYSRLTKYNSRAFKVYEGLRQKIL